MTGVMKLITTGATPAYGKTWKSIDWKRVEADVDRLQRRIAKATAEGKRAKVRTLQWLLTHSLCAKLLAVKRITSNKGAKTAGVDGVTWTTPAQKLKGALSLKRRGYRAQPLRRIEILKRNGKKRKLGIPTIYDRAMQALYKFALEPLAETLADGHSYGFRPKRGCRDAIAQCFNIFRCQPQRESAEWVLEADIKACFDEIDFEWLLENIPMDKTILAQWLKCGFMKNKKLFPTRAGTPQGGIISPLLANMTLDGLQKAINDVAPRRSKVYFVRYADDFIISAKSKELLEEKILPAIRSFLSERGLRLSDEKTRITHIDEGFDFLSQNVRRYTSRHKKTHKLHIKPAKDSVESVSENVRTILKKSRGQSADIMIQKLNPVMRGWANYHRHIESSKVYSRLDYILYNSLWQWLKKRHSNKSRSWIKKTYFSLSERNWFAVHYRDHKGKLKTAELIKFGDIHIEPHTKVKQDANPFNPEYDEYFKNKWKKRQIRHRKKASLTCQPHNNLTAGQL